MPTLHKSIAAELCFRSAENSQNVMLSYTDTRAAGDQSICVRSLIGQILRGVTLRMTRVRCSAQLLVWDFQL